MRNENVNKPQNQQSCQNAVVHSADFLNELKLEWCRSKEQHKSFEKDLIKYAKMVNNEQNGK
jgi:hypothetical protein